MLEHSLEILKNIESKGFKAYIIGGFVRDYILGVTSPDVDICTNATPKQIKEIFSDSFIPNEEYGSITVIYNKVRFEITTFRKEYDYINNRRPGKIEYIDSLLEDVKRRDFTINTLCMDSDKKIIDFLDGKIDIKQRMIRSVGDAYTRFTEDALRILRAVRFATTLNFKLSTEVYEAIIKTKKYLSNISYERKKSELDKIFMSNNASYGIQLLISLGLDQDLEIQNLADIKLSNDLLGVWSSINVSDKYPFTKTEKDLIKKIKHVYNYDNLDKKVLYKYGPYVNSICAINKGKNKFDVVNAYNSLPIKSRSDILITSQEIMEFSKAGPGRYINEIYNVLENEILEGKLENNKQELITFLNRFYLGRENEKQKGN